MATARDLVTDAFLWLAVNDAVDPPDPADMDMGIRWLNKLAGHLNNNALISSAITRTVFPLVSGTAAYTVGSGATVAVARPVNLTGLGEGVSIIDTTQDPDADAERGIPVMTDAQYKAIVQKDAQSSRPSGVYYDAAIASGFGVLRFYPVPNVPTLSAALYSRTPIGSFGADTVLVMQDGLRPLLETKLAKWLASTQGKQISAELREAATEIEAAYQAANTRLSDVPIDPAWLGGGRGENFYTGGPS